MVEPKPGLLERWSEPNQGSGGERAIATKMDFPNLALSMASHSFNIKPYLHLLILDSDYALCAFPTLILLSKLRSCYESRLVIQSNSIVPSTSLCESTTPSTYISMRPLCLSIAFVTCAASSPCLLHAAANPAIDWQTSSTYTEWPSTSGKHLYTQHGSNHTNDSSSGQIWQGY